MAAVAPPPSLQSISRNGWSAPNGTANGLSSMSADDVSRMLLPRKGAQRSNSSSSLASSASSTSTISAASAQSNGVSVTTNGDWAARKRPTRSSIWPTSKTEPTSGLSTARPQSITTATSGTSAATVMASLQAPSQMAPSPHSNMPAYSQQNAAVRTPQLTENTPVLYLTPMNGTFERKTITVPFYPDVIRIGRQTNGKTVPTPHNGYFDSKVLSRQHAEVWADRQGKIWIRDVKSSNGTFVNGQRLSPENKDSDPLELREQDMLELGIDIVSEDQKTVVHHKVAARVEHAGFYGAANNNLMELNFGDIDPSTSAGLLGASLGQTLGQMRRSASQGAVGGNARGLSGVAGGNVNNLAHQRQNHFWLAPVNMDQIVKKLNAEYKAAKQQSLDLQRAAQYIDSILTTDQTQRKESSQKSSPVERTKGMPSMKDSLKARFSDPPAPPPQAPLPEKPDVAHRLGSSVDVPLQAVLRRSDTERPRPISTNSSPVRTGSVDPNSASQIASLSEALNAAKKDMESQSMRLREVEDLLAQERMKREDAEKRAKRLENEREEKVATSPVATTNGVSHIEEQSIKTMDSAKLGSQNTESANDTITTQQLQQRLDLLMIELNDVKAAAERLKHEKEETEKERNEERAQRKSLSEMVEKLRAAEAERAAKQARKSRRQRRRQQSAGPPYDEEVTSAAEDEQDDEDDGGDEFDNSRAAVKSKDLIQNGHLSYSAQSRNTDLSDTLALATRPGHITQAAPYLSAMSVVLIGVAVMALVNKMQRGER